MSAESPIFVQTRRLPEIIRLGTRLYYQYWLTLTGYLALPWFRILLGILLWLVLPLASLFWIIDEWKLAHSILLCLVFILSLLPGMALFLNGFWVLMLRLSSLNLLIRDLFELGYCKDIEASELRLTSRSADYAVLLSGLLIFQALPLVVLFPLFAYFALQFPNLQGVLTILGLLLAVLVNGLVSLLFCLAYQVFAFEPGNVGAVVMTTLSRVLDNWPRALILILLTVVGLEMILPELFYGLLQLTGLSNILTHWVSLGVTAYIQETATNASFGEVMGQWPSSLIIAECLVSLVVTSSVAVLMLPLPTAWFAFLYADSKAK